MPSLPIIDMSLSQGSSRPALIKSLYEALTTSGFLYLKGVEGYDPTELLKITKWFFSLPEKKKLSVTKKMFDKNSNFIYRGYFPIQPQEISHKEGFEIGPPSKNLPKQPKSKEERILSESSQWPKTDNESEDLYFQEKMNFYYSLLTKTGNEIMELLAEAWGMEKSTFRSLFFPDHLSTFRLLHYPPREGSPPKEAIDGEYILQCSEHKDSGFLTLLSTFDYEGLQIRGSEDEWVDVKKMEGCLVVNIGELLATISGGVLKATNHRVVDKGEDRYSCPYFLEPNFHANVNIRLPKLPEKTSTTKSPKGKRKKMDVITGETEEYGAWLMNKMIQFAEFREILDFEA